MNKRKLTLVEAFAGIGMQRRGFDNSETFEVESLGIIELDINAIIAYAAVHCDMTMEMIEEYDEYPPRQQMADELKNMRIGFDFTKDKEYDWDKKVKSKSKDLEKVWLACKLTKNLGDIAKVNSFPKCGMFTFSFPCTDISVAGRQAGFDEGQTRSGLVWEVVRILKNMKQTNTLPNFLLMENVDALVNKKNLPQYEKLNEEFKDLGYNCVWKVINGKDAGVPQNRKRVFALYALDKIDISSFEFPTPFDTGKRLKDVLEDEVDLKYYVYNSKVVEMLQKLIDNGTLDEQIKQYDESKNP